jgi:CubicO group peptidase (beta-lactamase class C family)
MARPPRALLALACVGAAAAAAAGSSGPAGARARALPPRLHFPPPPPPAGLGADANCPVAPPLQPLPSPLPAALAAALAAVNATVRSLVGPALPGFALVLSYGDAVLLREAAGVANATSGLAWTPATPSRVASITKVLPAVLLHQLADAGALSLDGRVADDCPAFAVVDPWDAGDGGLHVGAPPGGANITWRQLASQLSGLQREAPAGAQTTPAALAAVAGTLLVAPPGARPSYSNLGFAVLGHLLAECVAPRAGLPGDLPALTAVLVTRPLGLPHAGYVTGADPGAALDAVMAAGTAPDGSPIPQADLDLGWAYPAGGGVASADELAALGRALLAAADVTGAAGAPAPGGGPLRLSPSTARALLAPLYREPDGSYLQGAPWEMRPRGGAANSTTTGSGAAPFLVLNKGGNLPGYTALLALVPALNVSLAAVFNGGADEFGLSDTVMDALLPPLAAALAAADGAPRGNPGPRPPATYTGTYAAPAVGGAVAVTALPQGGGGAAVGGGGPPPPPADALLFALQQGGTYSFFLDWVATLDAGAVAGVVGAGASAAGAAAGALNFTSADVFRAFFPPPGQLPPGGLPCVADVTLGLRGQYVFFLYTSGNATAPVAVAAPGFVPGVAYVRE